MKWFKGFFSSLIVLLATILPLSSVYAVGATLSLSPASGTYGPSCDFFVNVNLDTGGAQTAGTDVILFYDTTRLQAVSITNGSIYPDYPLSNIDAQNGKISVSGLGSASSSFSGQGLFATVHFKVVANAPDGATQVNFDFDPNNKSKTTDSNVAQSGTVTDILNQVVNGTYTIDSTAGCSGAGTAGVGGTGTGTGVGGTASGSATLTATPTVAPVSRLPNSGSTTQTLVLASLGGVMVIVGILGLTLF